MRVRKAWCGVVLLAGGLLLVGCGSTAGPGAASAPVSSSEVSASSPASPAASGSRPQAWVRGTKVVLTNGTSAALDVGSVSGYGDTMPQTQQTALAAGASRTESEEWRTTNGTSVAFRVVYADDDVLEFKVYNPSVGTPGVAWRTGYSVMNWSSTGQDAIDGDETFDENTSQTLDMDGHNVTVTRGGDDGDNKNWTVTLNG